MRFFLCFQQIKRELSTIILSLFLFFTTNISVGQLQSSYFSEKIEWIYKKNSGNPYCRIELIPSFTGAIIENTRNSDPRYQKIIQIPDQLRASVSLKNIQYSPEPNICDFTKLDTQVRVDKALAQQGDEKYLIVSFIPFRINPVSGVAEKVISFEMQIDYYSVDKRSGETADTVSSSVLATGKWYRLSVRESGVFVIDYKLLKSMGVDPDKIDPRNIRIYGNGGGMLPMPNSTARTMDLKEIAIWVSGEGDGKFDNTDNIYFYGQGPHNIKFNPGANQYKHLYNYYSDEAFYFLTISEKPGKRITDKSSLSLSPDYSTSDYDYCAFHERHLRTEVVDYVKSGRNWLGEEFNYVTTQKFTFPLQNLNPAFPVKVQSVVAGRSALPSFFTVKAASQTFSQNISASNTSYYLADYCAYSTSIFNVNAQPGDLELSYTYNKSTNDAVGWLDYININARCRLNFSSGQMAFRDTGSIGKFTEFKITNTQTGLRIWNVTDIQNVTNQLYAYSSGVASFISKQDTLSEFVAFIPSSAKTPKFVELVANQNLHGLSDVDMIIIVHPDFIKAAEKLAAMHREKHGLSVVLVTPQQIYNEFSSGAQDITAIRDFMKMLYDKALTPAQRPKYLLLFGDASYDYKDVLSGNTNFVPTYQSLSCHSPEGSYASDDYFGCLDDNEGNFDDATQSRNDRLDICIGRFPVASLTEAENVVRKTLNYVSNNSLGDWRNKLLFVADDPDEGGWNGHFAQSEFIAKYLAANYREYNIQKVYLDAFQQITSPNGQKYPDAQKAINDKVNNGTLLVNYIGHGGEQGWAHERVVEVNDIRSWKNFNKLALFVTATCEFSRYDDPGRISAGEWVLLNPNGGGVALLTTSRVVYSGSNDALLDKLYINNLFERNGNSYNTLGEIVRNTKNATGLYVNTRKFLLLGDPALTLACAEYNVVPTSVPDTFKAFSLVEIRGEIRNISGKLMDSFNGIVYPTIYDKSSVEKTLANDPGSKSENFDLQKNIIYKGRASIINGKFTFSLIVPKDISYAEGNGKISFYAENGECDAKGYYDSFIVGGTADSIAYDSVSPEIRLFLNDTNFVTGGITDENPLLIALIRDLSGINTVGNGVGHEIIAVLDNEKSFVLNDYYQSKLNSYTDGEVRFPLYNLEKGTHTVRVKVWDVANNSAEDTLDFIVIKGDVLSIEKLMNYPNPVQNSTTFSFEHNRPGEIIRLTLQIFNLRGEQVFIHEDEFLSEGSRVNDLKLDVSPGFGNTYEDGLYVYRVTLSSADGQSVQKSGKLIILR